MFTSGYVARTNADVDNKVFVFHAGYLYRTERSSSSFTVILFLFYILIYSSHAERYLFHCKILKCTRMIYLRFLLLVIVHHPVLLEHTFLVSRYHQNPSISLADPRYLSDGGMIKQSIKQVLT